MLQQLPFIMLLSSSFGFRLILKLPSYHSSVEISYLVESQLAWAVRSVLAVGLGTEKVKKDIVFHREEKF